MAERLTLFRYLFEVVGVGLVLVGEHFGHERSDITGVLWITIVCIVTEGLMWVVRRKVEDSIIIVVRPVEICHLSVCLGEAEANVS